MPELSPFSVLGLSLALSLLSLVRLSHPHLFLFPFTSIFLFLSISSQYLSAHLHAEFSRQTMHRATPRKHPLLLSRRRERGREKEGQRGQSCYPRRFGNLFPRPKALSALIRERVPSLSNFPDASRDPAKLRSF